MLASVRLWRGNEPASPQAQLKPRDDILKGKPPTRSRVHTCTDAFEQGLKLHYCTTALLHYCTTALLHYCTTALLHYCTTALLHYCTTALLHYCTTALLHYCTTALLHYCTGETLPAIFAVADHTPPKSNGNLRQTRPTTRVAIIDQTRCTADERGGSPKQLANIFASLWIGMRNRLSTQAVGVVPGLGWTSDS